MKISVVINTYNAEKHLATVLETAKHFDEVVVCDMHSTDNTIAIAEQYGCKIVYCERFPYVEPARNFAIAQAQNEWILVIDADETVPEKLREELYKLTEDPDLGGVYILKTILSMNICAPPSPISNCDFLEKKEPIGQKKYIQQ